VAFSEHPPSAAGGYARRRYLRGLRSWRRRTRRLAALCFGPFIALGIAGLLADRHPLAWLAGSVFGLGAAAWAIVRESPPGYVESWNRGSEGEQKTARALGALAGADWTFEHDIQNGHGNYDHVAIGAPGVFLLESKNPHGHAYTRDGQLWIRKHDDPDAERPEALIRRQALRLARGLHDQLLAWTGHNTWVQPVVVLWCPFAEETAQLGQCIVVHGPALADWLAQQPPRLDAATRQKLLTAVESIQPL
jgi:hypothetical protein